MGSLFEGSFINCGFFGTAGKVDNLKKKIYSHVIYHFKGTRTIKLKVYLCVKGGKQHFVVLRENFDAEDSNYLKGDKEFSPVINTMSIPRLQFC